MKPAAKRPAKKSKTPSYRGPVLAPGIKAIVTADQWFYASDGDQYKSVWGPIFPMLASEILGFRPSRSTNWFMQVGTGKNAILIAGCQIHYVQICHKKPKKMAKTGDGKPQQEILCLE